MYLKIQIGQIQRITKTNLLQVQYLKYKTFQVKEHFVHTVDLIPDSPNDASGWTPLRKKSQVDGIKRRLQLEERTTRGDVDCEPQDDSMDRNEEIVPKVSHIIYAETV